MYCRTNALDHLAVRVVASNVGVRRRGRFLDGCDVTAVMTMMLDEDASAVVSGPCSQLTSYLDAIMSADKVSLGLLTLLQCQI